MMTGSQGREGQRWTILAVLAGSLFCPAIGQAQMRITEYMYSGNGAANEFIEFTNVGATPIDLTGWSYDDSDMIDGPATSLTAF